ncbi:hypothetical protein [Actinomadura sp. 9N407]|uniref:hypothetical protein n=1 Tax=Actinomadura sp. 9N407 TaxID=3375154 RepID=UPI0037A74C55
MSVNIDFNFTVTDVTDEEQAQQIVRELDEMLRDEAIKDQVNLGVVFDEGKWFVSGETDFPLIITRFALWKPEFESTFRYCVGKVAAAAKVTIDWGYPDLEGAGR